MSASIAIIDDDDDVRESTRHLLRSRGYLTLAFASAEDFLRSGEVIQVACVVTDVRMPGMSGVELQSHLIAQGRRVPVIFITAFPEADSEKRALAAGAVCFLTKPFDGQTLINYLSKALKGAK